jgi:hypothetical protein
MDDTTKIIVDIFVSPDTDNWKEAIHTEIDSILSNETWELVDRSYGYNLIDCKWVFKKKLYY